MVLLVAFTATLPKFKEDRLTEAVLPPEVVLPVPDRVTVMGVELAELLMLQLAVSGSAMAGLKSIEAVQVLEASRVDPQVVAEMPKSLGSVPASVPALSVTVAVVPLVTVTV